MWSSRNNTKAGRQARQRWGMLLTGGTRWGVPLLALWLLLATPPRGFAAQPPLPLEEDEEKLELLWDRAQEAMGETRYTKAEKLLREYISLAPDDKAAFRDLARVLSWQRRYADALKFYDIYLDRISYDIDVAVERARVKAWMQRYPAAEADVREVLAREPENIDANLLLAGLLEWQGKKDAAEAQYRWVLKLDPANPTAKKGTQSKASAGMPMQLEARATYAQDNRDFFMATTRLGVRFFPLPRLSIMPFLAGALLDDEFTELMYGIGGGIHATLELHKTLELTGQFSGLLFPQVDSLVDWGGLLKAGWTPNTTVNFELGFDSYLYGPIGQSTRALEEELRYYRIKAGTYITYKRFIGSGEVAFAFLPLDPLVDETSIVTTVNLYPRFRVAGTENRFFVGTKHWYAAHTIDAPAEPVYGGFLYWSPAQYFTHQLALRLEGKMGKNRTYYLEGSGGFGHEFTPGDDTLVPPVEDDWSFFPVAGAALGWRRQWSEKLTTSADTWLSYSHRDFADYLLWNVTLNLIYRF